MGGHVTAVWADYPTVVGRLAAAPPRGLADQLGRGTLRGLVTTSEKRVPTIPDVPTLTETGIAQYNADIFYGIVAPARTPAGELAKLSDWFGSALKVAELQPKLAQQGLFPVGLCGAPFGDFMRRTADEYARIIREANIKVQ
jgi:tripartite-type tricarboxylate transporter receptor subunit TctC